MSWPVPALDLGNLTGGSKSLEDLAQTAHALHDALSTTGFVHLTNHGISKEKAPDAVKNAFAKPKDRVAYHGYSYAADLQGHKYREYYHWWPNNPEQNLSVDQALSEMDTVTLLLNYGGALSQIVNGCQDLCHLLFRLLARSLSLDDNTFARPHTGLGAVSVPNHTYLASIFYPPVADDFVMPLNKPRMGSHTDWDTFTLLFLDPIGGLEAKTTHGDWLSTDPIVDDDGTPSILLIVGDFLEKWSGGVYRATEHRVLVPTGENRYKPRLSFPYFVLPDNAVDVNELLKQSGDDGNTTVNVGDYFQGNALRTFNKSRGILD